MNNQTNKYENPVVNLLSDAKIIDSWHRNAIPWITAIREEQIDSRKLVTNNEIVEAVISHSPNSVLDIGCGEGWLAHRLSSEGIDRILGVDVVPELIAQAQTCSNASFQVLSYEDISKGAISEKFDVAVSNFALLGKESVDNLFRIVPGLLTKSGAFVVQTVHPVICCGDLPYVDGWREGSWAGFSSDFTDPAPWYFRTLESWVRLFTEHGFLIEEIKEPLNPKTQKAASIIFIGKLRQQMKIARCRGFYGISRSARCEHKPYHNGLRQSI
jgi:2-polyprenyl-3-methyl-5-hydroxy-6-metoxy-1,4-benzoquinol methylase